MRRSRMPPCRSLRSLVGERAAVKRSYDGALAGARVRGASFPRAGEARCGSFPRVAVSTAVE